MTEAVTLEGAPSAITGAALKGLAEELVELLKLRTLPIGMKLFEDRAAMERVPGLRWPRAGRRHSTCQLVTQARIAGFTLGITHDHVPAHSNCGGVIETGYAAAKRGRTALELILGHITRLTDTEPATVTWITNLAAKYHLNLEPPD